MSTRRLSYPGEIVISNDGSSLELSPTTEGFHIWRVYTHPKLTNRGYATKLFTRLCRFADKRGHVLTLEAGAFGHRTLPTSKVAEFYAKFGFQRRSNRPIRDWDIIRMRREPCLSP